MKRQVPSIHGLDGQLDNKLPRLMESSEASDGRSSYRRSKQMDTTINRLEDTSSTYSLKHQREMALEFLRKLCIRCSVPLGTKSISYFAKLPRPVKIAVILNETRRTVTRTPTFRTSTNICKIEHNKYGVSTTEPQEHLQNLNRSRQA